MLFIIIHNFTQFHRSNSCLKTYSGWMSVARNKLQERGWLAQFTLMNVLTLWRRCMQCHCLALNYKTTPHPTLNGRIKLCEKLPMVGLTSQVRPLSEVHSTTGINLKLRYKHWGTKLCGI